MFLNGSHSGLTVEQADDLQQDLQQRADFEHAKVTFSRSGTGNDVTLTWTVVLPPGTNPLENSTPAASSAAQPPSSLSASAETAFRFFVQAGWTPAQAAGLLGNIEAESDFDPSAVGDHGAACGICQWHSDRQAQFRIRFGHPMQQSTFEEQLDFVNSELREGNETKAGNLLKTATTAAEAGRIVSTNYERPSDVHGSEVKRAALAEKWFERFTS